MRKFRSKFKSRFKSPSHYQPISGAVVPMAMAMAAVIPHQVIKSRRKILCPFHQERTPSFMIYEDHGHCFACDWHGGPIKFVMEIKSYSYQQAKELMSTLGLL